MSSLSKNGDFCEFNKWLRTLFVKKPAHAGVFYLPIQSKTIIFAEKIRL